MTDNELMVVLAEALVSCGDHVEAPHEGRRGGGGGPEEEVEEDGAGRELHLGGGLPPLRVKEFSGLEDESGAVVWDAALVLLHHLAHMHHTHPACSPLRGRCVVELGCGPGAVGLAAAVLMGEGSSGSGSSSGTGGGDSSCGSPTDPQPRVLLTDLPHLLPHVRGNVRTCRPARSAPVDVLPLEWGNAAHLRAVHAWHVAAAAGRLGGGGAGQPPRGEQPGRPGPPEDGTQGRAVEASDLEPWQGDKPGTYGADGLGDTACERKAAADAAASERGGSSGSESGGGGGGGGSLGLLVLGSDLVYSAASRPALVATVAGLLRGAAAAAGGTERSAGGAGRGGPALCDARCAAAEPLALLSFEDRPGVEELPGLCKAHGLEAIEVEQQLLHPDWRSPDLHVWRLRLAPCATDSWRGHVAP